MDPRHSKQSTADGIHTPIAYEYANAAARTGATGFTAADIGKFARQLDDNSVWMLLAVTPTWTAITAGSAFVPTSRQVIAGAGLTGGGDLTVDRTFDVGANADGSITVNPNDIQVGVLATDAQHGTRGGGTQHAVAVAAVSAGFLSGADKDALDKLLEVKDEGTSLGTGKRKLNFIGAGVSAAISGPDQIDVTIAGSGSATITVKDEGTSLTPDKNTLNIVGPGITATTDGGNPSQANITIGTAAPGTIAVGDTAAEGSADSLARSDHRHALPAPAAPANVTKAAASAGAATTVARADHKHDVSTAAPAATGVSTASAEGAATTLARSDHSHQSNTAPADVTKAAAAIGTSGEPARADHKHDVTTAAPVNVGDTLAEGTATSLARSDHVHRAEFPCHIFGNNSVTATTTTRYLTPGYTAGTAPTAPVQYRVPSAGTVRRLRVRHNTGAGNGLAIVYTVRINNTPSAVTLSLASTATDGSDLVNTVAVAAGDLIDIEVTKAASVGTSPAEIMASLEVFV